MWNILILLLFIISSHVSCAQTVGDRPQQIEDVFLPEEDGVAVKVWIENLEIPWSLAFLPDGRALVSERPGRIRLIKNAKLQKNPMQQSMCLPLEKEDLWVLHFTLSSLKNLMYMPCIHTKKRRTLQQDNKVKR